MIARIIVTPKKSVLDPQGEAVRRAIHSLGFDAVSSARIGKYIELEVSGTNAELIRKKLDEISGDLLSNPVVEDYVLQLEAAPAAAAKPLPTKAAIATAIKAIKAEPEPKVEAKPKAKAAAAPAPKKVAVKATKVAKPVKASVPKAVPAKKVPAKAAKKK